MDDPIGGQLLFQLFLILVNAFFAATEIAVLHLNENKVRKLAEDGDKKAVTMIKLIESPNRFLSTIQICITLSGFLGSAFAADNFASRLTILLVNAGVTFISAAALNTICVVLITFILSYFTLVLGELTPKRIALQYSDKIARFSCGIINAVSKFFKPIVWLLSVSTNSMLRLFRINPATSSEEVTEDEIRMLLDIGGESGAIEQNERTMIENIFEFNNMTAEDVMLHRMDVVAFHVDEQPEEIVKAIRESGLSRFPVYEADIDDIIGILNTRDFLLNLESDSPKGIRNLLRPAHLVPETVQADTLFRDMQRQKVHMSIVVDEYGGMSGIVTMEDLLEEIVGNIYDEFDPTEKVEIEQLEDNLWRVSGAIDLETLSDTLGVALPLDEEYDTLSGMVFSSLSVIPEEGSTLDATMYGLDIHVEQICDHRVENALIQKVLTFEEAAEKGPSRENGEKALKAGE